MITLTSYGQPWSNGDLETLARLRDEGKTYAECAAHLGRTECAVRKRLSRAGQAKASGDWARWTVAEDEVLRLGIAEGRPHRQIAQELGRTKAAVAMRACLLRGTLGTAR